MLLKIDRSGNLILNNNVRNYSDNCKEGYLNGGLNSYQVIDALLMH